MSSRPVSSSKNSVVEDIGEDRLAFLLEEEEEEEEEVEEERFLLRVSAEGEFTSTSLVLFLFREGMKEFEIQQGIKKLNCCQVTVVRGPPPRQ